ncbi:MAG: DUF551 domain-containing protein [Bacteroidota bacterium]|nr:DUF551 domain-containing protein [Bacteroidota bacterium]
MAEYIEIEGYSSPIMLLTQDGAAESIKRQEEQLVCKLSQAIGYQIDKEQLVKALQYDRKQYEKGFADGFEQGKALEQKSDTWSLEDAREDFMYDVYNELDFLPTNVEANRIIDSFDRVTGSIKQEPRWFPVSERLPDKEGTYLLWGRLFDDEEYYCFIGDYDEGCERFGYWQEQFDPHTLGCLGSEFYEYECVLAWQELPKPYRENKEDKK